MKVKTQLNLLAKIQGAKVCRSLGFTHFSSNTHRVLLELMVVKVVNKNNCYVRIGVIFY